METRESISKGLIQLLNLRSRHKNAQGQYLQGTNMGAETSALRMSLGEVV